MTNASAAAMGDLAAALVVGAVVSAVLARALALRDNTGRGMRRATSVTKPRGRKTFRNRASVATIACLGLANTSLVVVLGQGSFAAVAVAIVAAAMTIRAMAAGVTVAHERVLVRNPFRTYSIGWDSVLRFDVDPRGTPLLRRKAGRRVVLWGMRDVGNLMRPHHPFARAMVDLLNRDLDER